jgi:hypothetical protein
VVYFSPLLHLFVLVFRFHVHGLGEDSAGKCVFAADYTHT